MSNDAERRARLALAVVNEPGSVRRDADVDRLGAEEVWQRLVTAKKPSAAVVRAKRLDIEAVERETRLRGMRFVIPGDSEWPASLDDLSAAGGVGDSCGGAPYGLWVVGPGNLASSTEPSIAVVGSRAATAYGESVASEISAGLAGVGVGIVSGGAYGIDAAAHRGALGGGGATVAVMACGLTSLYPRGNDGLLSRIARDHVVVSEYPPGTPPNRSRFLSRNRLIAALGDATLLVEAAARSGARNTVSWAQALGRPVLAVPGPVTSAQSLTPHRLVRDGVAALVTDVADILSELGPLGVFQPYLVDPCRRPTDDLLPDELAIHEAMPSRGGRWVEELVASTGLEPRACMEVLTRLESKGLVDLADDGQWRLTSIPTG